MEAGSVPACADLPSVRHLVREDEIKTDPAPETACANVLREQDPRKVDVDECLPEEKVTGPFAGEKGGCCAHWRKSKLIYANEAKSAKLSGVERSRFKPTNGTFGAEWL